MSRVILDTGPLVAFLNRRDCFHQWAVDRMKEVSPPLFTCEAVLAEACYLLRRFPGGPEAVVSLVERELVAVPYRFEPEAAAIRRLLERYADVPMSFADACLVRMVEEIPSARVMTIDRDFGVYRVRGRQSIPVLLPSEV